MQSKLVTRRAELSRDTNLIVSRYLMEGAELIDTTSNAMDRLLQYLDSNLTTLHDNLNEDNFNRVLLVIWEIMSQTLYELVNSNLEVFVTRI